MLILPRLPDRFQEWLNVPLLGKSEDSRFTVHRALPSEFDEIYELVDQGFGAQQRSRAEYDWLYRRNPGGFARCWVVVEKESGRVVASCASFPWSLAQGDEPLDAYVTGDLATAPGFQRQGVFGLLLEGMRQHPWKSSTVKIASPNAKSRGAVEKHGMGKSVIGPFPGGLLLLRARSFLSALRWPDPLARVVGALGDASIRTWQGACFTSAPQVSIEEVKYFEAEFDRVTAQCMSSQEFWCPHDSEFLNWRYIDHPTKRYLSLAALDRGTLVGYAVLRLDGHGSTLMELAAPPAVPHVARDLLSAVISAAREAGATFVHFFGSPDWRHWRLLRRAGFLPLRTGYYLYASGGDKSQIRELGNWQVMPGDQDWT